MLTICVGVIACKEEQKEEPIGEEIALEEEIERYEFGFNLNDFLVLRDTIKKGDTFGKILERNKIGYSEIYNIVEKTKDSFNIAKLQVGKPYTLLCSNDSLQQPKCFIYQPNKEEYVVINFQDSIHAYTNKKPIKYVEKELTGVITSSISQTLDSLGISQLLANKMADDIYAWTIDFNRLYPGDRF